MAKLNANVPQVAQNWLKREIAWAGESPVDIELYNNAQWGTYECPYKGTRITMATLGTFFLFDEDEGPSMTLSQYKFRISK